jgi:endoglucanase
MSAADDIDLLKRLCSTPTAPFAEHRVIEFVERWARRRRRLSVRGDRFGNRLIECPGSRRLPRLVMVAHGDHPGLIAGATNSDGTLHADFHGGVMPEYLPGADVQFFASRKPVAAKVIKVEPDERGRASKVALRAAGAVPPGTLGMFALGEARVRGKRMHCRVCDDLAGVSAALATLDRLARKPSAAPVALLLTRAEEQGFIGAVAAVEHPSLLRKTDLLISLECSAEQPYARQGQGVIVRVGDRTSIFDSSLTAFIVERAAAIASEDGSFRLQRALMPGGTCEATVFDAWGYTSAAVCVALGNYHNMDRAGKRVAAEYIHLDDWRAMVTLLESVAREAHRFEPGMQSLRRKLVDRFERYRPLL